MKTIDFDNIKACDLTDGDGLLEAYKTYLQEVLEYSEFEAEIAATDMENPYDAPFVLQEYEGNFTIDGIEYPYILLSLEKDIGVRDILSLL